MKKEFNGKQEGKDIKLILKSREAENLNQWMAKPKTEKINTQHFVKKFDMISVHEDSPEGNIRYMENYEMAGSMFLPMGSRFIDSDNKDIAVLPMEDNCEGFSVELAQSGASVNMPQDGFILLALGKWGNWRKKSRRIK